MKLTKKTKRVIITIIIILFVAFVVWFLSYPYCYVYAATHKMDYTPSESEYDEFLSSFGIIATNNIVSVDEYSFTYGESYLYSHKLDIKADDLYTFFTQNVICECEAYIDSDGNICIPDEWYSHYSDEMIYDLSIITPDGKEVTTTRNGSITCYDTMVSVHLQNELVSDSSTNRHDYLHFLISQNEEGEITISCCDYSSNSRGDFLDSIYNEHFYDEILTFWFLNHSDD